MRRQRPGHFEKRVGIGHWHPFCQGLQIRFVPGYICHREMGGGKEAIVPAHSSRRILFVLHALKRSTWRARRLEEPRDTDLSRLTARKTLLPRLKVWKFCRVTVELLSGRGERGKKGPRREKKMVVRRARNVRNDLSTVPGGVLAVEKAGREFKETVESNESVEICAIRPADRDPADSASCVPFPTGERLVPLETFLVPLASSFFCLCFSQKHP